MPINDPYALQAWRAPRAKVLTDGKEIPGLLSINVINNNYYQSDSFRIQFALNASKDFNIAWWGDIARKQILLDIQASLDEGQTFKSLLIGQVDHMSVAIDKGIVEVDGRDLSAYFIDTKTQETFLNKTSSQVAEILAGRHGLQANVTPTSTLVGRYYSDDHDRMNMGQFSRTTTEWNLLCSLAQHEQFDVYVTGRTLNFVPATDPDSDPYLVIYDQNLPWANAMTLDLSRSMNMAKDVVVQVRSWNSRKAHSITKYSPSGPRDAAIQSGKAQMFSFVVPNLTQDEAQKYANKMHADITKHERLFAFTMPADLLLQPRMMLKLQGTGSSWDQAYYVDSVTRNMEFAAGFTMTVKTKNHSPQSQAPSL